MMKKNSVSNIPVGSGWKDIYLFIIKQGFPAVLLILLLIFGITTPFAASYILNGDLEGFLGTISISIFIFGLTSLALPFVLLITIVTAILIYYLSKNGNSIQMRDRELIVNHQNWSLVVSVQNSIPISKIKRVEKADNDFWKERWRDTKWYWKIMRLHPLPPKGGLYPMYSRRKNLLILYLSSPIKINNQKVTSLSVLGMTVNEYWVKEIIIDVDPEYQDLFIDEIMKRKSDQHKL